VNVPLALVATDNDINREIINKSQFAHFYYKGACWRWEGGDDRESGRGGVKGFRGEGRVMVG